jgi:hypothetical protein
MEKSRNGLKVKIIESIFYEKSDEIQKGVRNESIPNPFCRQTDLSSEMKGFFIIPHFGFHR